MKVRVDGRVLDDKRFTAPCPLYKLLVNFPFAIVKSHRGPKRKIIRMILFAVPGFAVVPAVDAGISAVVCWRSCSHADIPASADALLLPALSNLAVTQLPCGFGRVGIVAGRHLPVYFWGLRCCWLC
jgi:hypothetical protein